jgi:hypothetical protein
LSSAPPHEHTLGDPTGVNAYGKAAAASQSFFFFSPQPPLGPSVPPQQFTLRSPPHQYTLGAPTGKTACGNAAAASASSSTSPSPPLTVRATVAAASLSPSFDTSAPPQQYFFSAVSSFSVFSTYYRNSNWVDGCS